MVGFWVSFTVIITEQYPVLPAQSVAEKETMVVPTGKLALTKSP
jgi:hypothetical protein